MMEEINPDIQGVKRLTALLKRRTDGTLYPGVKGVSILYSVTILLFLYIGVRMQNEWHYPGLALSEILVIAMPAIIFLFIRGYDIKKTLRIKPVKITSALVIMLGIAPCAMIAAAAINTPIMLLIKKVFGNVQVDTLEILPGAGGLALSILVIAGSAGVCEELLFRGTIMRGLEETGRWKALVITGLMFGLMHMDFQKLAATTLLGIMIGYIVMKCDSIFAGMLAHFCNNAYAVLISTALAQSTPSGAQKEDANEALNTAFAQIDALTGNDRVTAYVMLFMVFAVMFIIAATFITGWLFLLHLTVRKKSGTDEAVVVRQPKKLFPAFLWAIPGLVLIGILYVYLGAELANIAIPDEITRIIRMIVLFQF